MLTRREVEGQLRTVHPLRAEALRRRQSMVKMRRYVRIGMITVLSILVLITAALTVSASRVAPTPARRDAAWGVEHVTGYGKGKAAKAPSVFGRSKRGGGGGGSSAKRRDPRWNFAH
jgi:hypothetical protein